MDKITEKYLRAVRRRLNMPKALKDRVIADLLSSIEARKEDGQQESEILAELGTPKQAAGELNAQMKEYTYRKSPWRWACLGVSVLSVFCIAYNGLRLLLLQLFNTVNNASIGIIGGADGPTSIFITTSAAPTPAAGIYALALVAGIVGFMILSKLKQK